MSCPRARLERFRGVVARVVYAVCAPAQARDRGVRAYGKAQGRGSWRCCDVTDGHVPLRRGSMPMPMKYNGYYYFEASAGTHAWASIYWW